MRRGAGVLLAGAAASIAVIAGGGRAPATARATPRHPDPARRRK